MTNKIIKKIVITLIAPLRYLGNALLFVFKLLEKLTFNIRHYFNINAKDHNGNTKLMLASKNRDLTTVNALLEKKAKVTIVNNDGDTALIFAVKNNHSDIVTALLNSFALPRQAASKLAFMSHHNNEGYSASEEAFRTGTLAIVQAWVNALIETHNSLLPQIYDLLRQNEALNNQQNTHTASVHDACARTAIALVARYLKDENCFSESELTTLTLFSKAEIGDTTGDVAVKIIMEKPLVKSKLQDLTKKYNREIKNWLNTLVQTDSPNFPVNFIKDVINRIMGMTNFCEAYTNLTPAEMLALTWISLNDPQHDDRNFGPIDPKDPNKGYERKIDRKQAYTKAELAERTLLFKKYLDELHREYPIDNTVCPGGTFNKLALSLKGQDHDARFAFATKAAMLLKAHAFMDKFANNFTVENYTDNKESFQKLINAFEDAIYLGKATKATEIRTKVKREIMLYLQAEFEKSTTLELITEVANDVLELPKPEALQIINDKLNVYQEKLSLSTNIGSNKEKLQEILEEKEPVESADIIETNATEKRAKILKAFEARQAAERAPNTNKSASSTNVANTNTP